jgi:hypothetical protein
MEEKKEEAKFIDKIFNSFYQIYKALKNLKKYCKKPKPEIQDSVYAQIHTINNELTKLEEASENISNTYIEPQLVNTRTNGSNIDEYHRTMIDFFEFQVQCSRGRISNVKALLDAMGS